MIAPGDPSAFTLKRVQALLGLSRAVISGLIAEGFVSPTRGARNEHRFSFQDLMLLRTAHALQASHIPPRKILRALARLKANLPDELPLTGLRITAIGSDVAVRDRNGRWEAASGQLLMDFEVAQVAGNVAFLERSAPEEKDDAPTWFRRGEAEEGFEPDAAERSYRQALALSPDYIDAYLNLGAMWCEAGRFAEALELYDRAVTHCPDSALLHFNRAVALEDLQRLNEAIASYERCLELDPKLADAHFNLGRLQEQLGDARGALRHFSAYRRLQR